VGLFTAAMEAICDLAGFGVTKRWLMGVETDWPWGEAASRA